MRRTLLAMVVVGLLATCSGDGTSPEQVDPPEKVQLDCPSASVITNEFPIEPVEGGEDSGAGCHYETPGTADGGEIYYVKLGAERFSGEDDAIDWMRCFNKPEGSPPCHSYGAVVTATDDLVVMIDHDPDDRPMDDQVRGEPALSSTTHKVFVRNGRDVCSASVHQSPSNSERDDDAFRAAAIARANDSCEDIAA